MRQRHHPLRALPSLPTFGPGTSAGRPGRLGGYLRTLDPAVAAAPPDDCKPRSLRLQPPAPRSLLAAPHAVCTRPHALSFPPLPLPTTLRTAHWSPPLSQWAQSAFAAGQSQLRTGTPNHRSRAVGGAPPAALPAPPAARAGRAGAGGGCGTAALGRALQGRAAPVRSAALPCPSHYDSPPRQLRLPPCASPSPGAPAKGAARRAPAPAARLRRAGTRGCLGGADGRGVLEPPSLRPLSSSRLRSPELKSRGGERPLPRVCRLRSSSLGPRRVGGDGPPLHWASGGSCLLAPSPSVTAPPAPAQPPPA